MNYHADHSMVFGNLLVDCYSSVFIGSFTQTNDMSRIAENQIRKSTMVSVFPDPFWKFGTASDIRNMVYVANFGAKFSL